MKAPTQYFDGREKIRMRPAIFHRSVLATLVAIVISFCGSWAHADTDPYLKIAEGDSRARVVSLLGEPVDPSRDLSAAERKNIRSALKITDNKGAVEFVIWKRSGQLFYLIGFNRSNTVATKHRLLTLARGG